MSSRERRPDPLPPADRRCLPPDPESHDLAARLALTGAAIFFGLIFIGCGWLAGWWF